ncbi:MAG: NTP transferase domain-containing protein [Firmicutes bacterium]|nr:NTP transferase domain-containing protein [Bacillota bacterium]
MKAVIMAGGAGSRLRPLTCGRPKPLVPVANKPILQYLVELLRKHGFREILVTACYLSKALEDFFGNGERFGVRMSYLREELPLGTAGSVKAAEGLLDGTFLVVSGDALTDFKLNQAVDFHLAQGAMATILLAKVQDPTEYGVVVTADDGRIRDFREKPAPGEVISDTVNTGIYVLDPEVLRLIPPGRAFDFSKDLFPLLLRDGLPLFGWAARGYWSDIGSLDQYRQAHWDILSGRLDAVPPGREAGEGVFLGEGVEIAPGCSLVPPVVIGGNARLAEGCTVGPYAVLGDNSCIREGATVKLSILWDGTYVDRGCELRGTVICDQSKLMSQATALEGSVLGPGCVLGRRAGLRPEAKVWPGKVIDDDLVVRDNLVWGFGLGRGFFRGGDVSGLANLEISPEMCARLGAAFGSALRPEQAVVVASNASCAAEVARNALVCGLISTGVKVFDAGRAMLPQVRFAISRLPASGGLQVSTVRGEPGRLAILFLDQRGLRLSRSAWREVEHRFWRGEPRRVQAEDMQQVVPAHAIAAEYAESMPAALGGEVRRGPERLVVVECEDQWLCEVVRPIFARLGHRVHSITRNGGIRGKEGLLGEAGSDKLPVAALRSHPLWRRTSGSDDHWENSFRWGVRPLDGGDGKHLEDRNGRGQGGGFDGHWGMGMGTAGNGKHCCESAQEGGYGEDRAGEALLGSEVRALEADLGFSMDGTGEMTALVDDEGKPVPPDLRTALLSLVLIKIRQAGELVLPVTAPAVAEQLASSYGIPVARVGAAQRSAMERSSIIFDPAFDALSFVAGILDLLIRDGLRLSGLLRSLPPVHTARDKVPCPWEKRGVVMRRLLEEAGSTPMEFLDGVRLYHPEGVALILPDDGEPRLWVYSEGNTPQDASALARAYVMTLTRIIS